MEVGLLMFFRIECVILVVIIMRVSVLGYVAIAV
jgi:hypothetical protein